MSREQLIAHTVSLQNAYAQLENDSSYQAWEVREVKNSLNYFSIVAKLANRLNAAGIETIAEIVLTELPWIFNCSRAALFLYDDDTETLNLHAASGSFPTLAPLNRQVDGNHLLFQLFLGRLEPFMTEYIQETKSIIIDGQWESSIPVTPEWLEIFANRAIVFPLTMKQQDEGDHPPLLLGGIVVGDPKGAIELNNVDFSFIFGNLISSSLHNAMLIHKLNDMTIIDPLTNLFNRRHLINLLSASMTQARRQPHDLAIAMLDIDHFKRCNDTYGHVCGDEVLRQVGERIKLSIRNEVDLPARYGGEEFVVIMPYTDMDRAMIVAERVRSDIMDSGMIWEDKKISITCSLGVAEYVDGETVEQFIDRADMALYQAKRTGRNQVIAAASCA
jgi:diguanylate cyclase (GGDEF)-like protein